PETAYRGLGGTGGLAFNPAAAHSNNGGLSLRRCDAALYKTADTAIFHRHETGWTAQIEVPKPALAHLRRIIGITEIDPLQVRAIDSVGREEADRHGVLSFLQDKVWKDRDDLVSNAVWMLVDDVHQPLVFELVILVDGSHPGVGLVVRFRRGEGLGTAAAAVRADDQAATLAQPVKLERSKKQM